MKRFKAGLLVKIIIAIIAGALIGLIAPEWLTRLAATVTRLFGDYLNFVIPLIILGLVAPGIAELGKGAGWLLAITVILAVGSTIFSGFFTYGFCQLAFPPLLGGITDFGTVEAARAATPYFTLDIPPVMGVMSALLLAFLLGIFLAQIKQTVFKNLLYELRDVVNGIISKTIIPVLPIYIAFIFIGISSSGQVASVMHIFVMIIAVIFVLHIALLVLYFTAASLYAGSNPFKNLKTMLPAYLTALGTQSSAATIPITLQQTLKMGVSKEVAGFVVPLCATIHLAGSMMKVTGCAIAIMIVSGMSYDFGTMVGFILLLSVAMIAAPGVPGGSIMAALAILSSVLGFDGTTQALTIALYIALDGFGTACNVTGDGAIALVVDKLNNKRKDREKSRQSA